MRMLKFYNDFNSSNEKFLQCSEQTGCIKTIAASLALTLCLSTPAFADDQVPIPDNHAYTLTKVDQQGTNTITKYEWSETENKLTPVYYRVDLKQTDYGHTTDYDEVKPLP